MPSSAGEFALSACLSEQGRPLLQPDHQESPSNLNAWLSAWENEGLKSLCLQRLAQIGAGQHKALTRALLLWQSNQFKQSSSELNSLIKTSPIQFIVFKGHGTTGMQYSSRSARNSRDIDLLIKPDDLSEFQSYLNSRGYIQNPVSPHVFNNHVQELDLHTQLFDKIPWNHKISQEDIWRAAIPMQGAGLRLCLEYEFLLALSHATTHGFGRMIWLLDLALLKKNLGADHSQQLATSHGMLRAYRWMEHLHRTLFGLPAAVHSFNWPERLLLHQVQARRSGDRIGRLFLLLGIQSTKERWSYLWKLVWGEEQSVTRIRRLARAVLG